MFFLTIWPNRLKFLSLFLVLIYALFSATGCAKTTVKRLTLKSAPNTCEVFEVRPSWLSTLVMGVCWDGDGEVIGMVGGAGTSVVKIPLTAVTAGAILGGGILIGKELENLAIPRDF